MCGALVVLVSLQLHGSLVAKTASKISKPFGIEKRVLWTTSRIDGSPDPPSPYRTENAFPKLKFEEPLSLVAIPGSSRLGVAQRRGKIDTFSNDPAASQTDLLMDLGRPVYAIEFHPRFSENGYFYASSVLGEGPAARIRLARYQVSERQPPRAKPESELVLVEWPGDGHTGGCLRFGPDGYLFVAVGDSSGIADGLKTGQDVSDLSASILRIDVDHPDPNKAYGIPRDNPFVNLPGARPEIWAYGLRQAWKFSFDWATGNLWAGEVGQDLWESIHLIQKGGNYGWSVNEGSHPFRPDRPKGPTPLLKPIVEHSHTDFRSIIGGWIYHGKRLAELKGAYIYGDYDTGKIWLMRYDGHKVVENRELVDTQLRIVDIGQDAADELYIVDHVGGAIHRLVPAPLSPKNGPKFPRKLSETGLFTSTKKLQPAAGLIPYSVTAPLWSDGALKERYIALPGDSKIEYDKVIYPQPAPGALPGWKFPHGAVLVKTFLMEMEPGNRESVRRLETRILHHELIPGSDEVGADIWHGYTYVWNDSQSDAYLLDAAGLDRKLVIKDSRAPGGKREQIWHFPSRAECTLCHTTAAKYVLGVDTQQMNKDHDYGGVIANQLRTLEHLGVFSTPLPAPPEKLPRLYDYQDETVPLDRRARSYLQANCAHCHRKWGGGNAEFQMLFTLPLEKTGAIHVPPAHGNFGVANARLLVPGHPEQSMILQRMFRLGLGRMPHVASNVVDQQAVRLIEDWIRQLPPLPVKSD